MANKNLHRWFKNTRMAMAFGSIIALGSLLGSCNDLMHDDLPTVPNTKSQCPRKEATSNLCT